VDVEADEDGLDAADDEEDEPDALDDADPAVVIRAVASFRVCACMIDG